MYITRRLPFLFLLSLVLLPATRQGRAQSQDPIDRFVEETKHLPLYTAAELKLDPDRLVPSRVIMRPLNNVFGDIFEPNVQVITSIERSIETDFSTPGKPVFKGHGFRIQWRANTHNNMDEAWVDAQTFALQRTIFNYDQFTLYHPDKVLNTVLPRDSSATTVVTLLEEPAEFHQIIVLPYLFAAMGLEAGVSFRLRGFSTNSNREYPIRVDVIGEEVVADASGQERVAWRVDSKNPGAHITWYIDQHQAPHYVGYIWRTLDADGTVIRESRGAPVAWYTFDRDQYGNMIKAQE